MATFIEDIAAVINRHSRENDSNTPDFILANYLENCLAAFNRSTQQRGAWYGRETRPSLGTLPEPPQNEDR